MHLASIADRTLGQKLRGVVVITDGLDRGALRDDLLAWLDSGGAEGGSAGRFVPPPLPGPLTLYQVGQLGALRPGTAR